MRITAPKFLLVLSIMVVLSFGFFAFPSSIMAASLSLSPATANKSVGETFAVDIVLDTEGAAASGATAILSYDTAKLQVNDDDSTGTGVNIAGGSNLTQVLTNSVDTSIGQIRYDAGNLGASYTGRGVIATIHFKALSEGTAQVSFVFDPNKTTDTSAVAAASGPTSLLSTVNDGTYSIGESTGEPLPETGAIEDTLMLLGFGGVFLATGFLFARRAFRAA